MRRESRSLRLRRLVSSTKITSKECAGAVDASRRLFSPERSYVAPLIARRNRYARRVLPNGFVRRTRDTCESERRWKGGSACQWCIERRWRSGVDSLNSLGRKPSLRFALWHRCNGPFFWGSPRSPWVCRLSGNATHPTSRLPCASRHAAGPDGGLG